MNSHNLARGIRTHALRMVHKATASHIGGCLSSADLLAVCYQDILNIYPDNPEHPDRDRFVLSKGHCCAGVYAALALSGYFPAEELEQYGEDGGLFMTHINHKVPGVEFSTGSLGHGLPFACGKALSSKINQQNWRVFALLSDGELDEGSNWESILFAPQHQLDNLVVIVDYNKIQSLGSISEIVSLEPLKEKFESFNWVVREIDGHDHDAIRSTLQKLPWTPGKPNCLIANTVKGKGVSFMENKLLWHYRNPNDEQLRQALSEIEGVE